MASVRAEQVQGLRANCSDMSDMLVCLVTPHSFTATKVGPTPLRRARPEQLAAETWGVTEPQPQGQECTPGPPFKSIPPPPPPPPPVTQCPFNPSSIPSLATRTPQSTPRPLPPEQLHFPPWILSLLSVSTPHTLTLTALHLLAPHHPPPPTSVAFQGCVFHALVAGQALGDFPRWALKVGQEPVVWSDVRAGTRLCVSVCVCVCALSLHIFVSACVGVYSLNSLQKASCTNAALNERGVELTGGPRRPVLLCPTDLVIMRQSHVTMLLYGLCSEHYWTKGANVLVLGGESDPMTVQRANWA